MLKVTTMETMVEPLAMLGCYTACNWRIIPNPKLKTTRTYILNQTHVSIIKKYAESYRNIRKYIAYFFALKR